MDFDTTDLVLLLLGLGSGPSGFQGATRLEKLLFLASKELPQEKNVNPPNFQAYKYGPFSKEIYDSLEFLRSFGLVDADDSPLGEDPVELRDYDPGVAPAYEPRSFRLTQRGQTLVSRLQEELPPVYRSDLANLVSKYGRMPLAQLIKYVYARYPDFTEKSVIKDQVTRQPT